MADINEYSCLNLLLPEIVYGLGARKRLAVILGRSAAGDVLVITDKGLVGAGIVDQVCGEVTAAGRKCHVFEDVDPDPDIHVAENAIEYARTKSPILIIGLGGGSPLDITKVTAALLDSDREISSYFGTNKVEKKCVATILIPTTAGTGTEVAIAAVLSDKKKRLKSGIRSPFMLCDAAILDPELTVSCPPSITASSGIDALTHAIEVYTNLKASRLVEPFVLEAIRMIYANIRLAYVDGSNLLARSEMLLASMYAGIGMQVVNNAAVHALSSPLGALYDVPHGVANSVLLPYVMEFNRSSCIHKYAKIADALGAREGMDDTAKSEAAVIAVKDLIRSLGIRNALSGLRISASDLSSMAELSLQVWLMANNPRNVTREDALTIYQKAFTEEQITVVH